MVPRTEVVSIDQEDTVEYILEMVQEERFTRYPVIDGDKESYYWNGQYERDFNRDCHEQQQGKNKFKTVYPSCY